jgi:hypothetical protein
VFVGATALEPPIHRSLVADADISHLSSFESSLFLFLLFFGYIYLIVTLVPFVFGFSVHLLGCHCPLSFGCAIFECGGVMVFTRSTLTTLVTLVLILLYL